jgi:hypothetical protein
MYGTITIIIIIIISTVIITVYAKVYLGTDKIQIYVVTYFPITGGYHWYARRECILAGNGAVCEAVKKLFMTSVKCLIAYNSCSQIYCFNKFKSDRSGMLNSNEDRICNY